MHMQRGGVWNHPRLRAKEGLTVSHLPSENAKAQCDDIGSSVGALVGDMALMALGGVVDQMINENNSKPDFLLTPRTFCLAWY